MGIQIYPLITSEFNLVGGLIYFLSINRSAMRSHQCFVLLFVLFLPLSGCLDEQNRDDDEDDSSESIAMMQARADDHADEVTTNTNDNLMNIEVTYLKNVELQWSDLIITLDDDGDGTNQITCSNPGQASTSDCKITEIQGNGDGIFDLGERITISESGVDICSTNYCEKYVTIYGDSTRFADNQPWDRVQVFME